jgi:hypothetical protein
MNFIAFTAYRRPDYLAHTLDALAACEGIEDYTLLPHVEPGNDEVRSLVEAIDFAASIPTWNASRLTVGGNTAEALRDGFGRADFLIFFEEDVPFAPDALRFYEWAAGAYRDDRDVSTITAYNRQNAPVDLADHHRVGRRSWFHGVTFATWRDRYRLIERHLRGEHGWDGIVLGQFVENWGMKEVFPVLGRADHIGLVSSCQSPLLHPPEWFLANATSPCWAGNQEVAEGDWSEPT